MKTFNFETFFANYENCMFSLNKYRANDALAIQIWNEEDGPIAVLTVCIPEYKLKENETFIDVNNCPWAVELVGKLGLGTFTGLYGRSGYCTYPAVEFNKDELEKYVWKEE